MQNSQRVRDAKPRTAPGRGGASREARRPSIAPYRNGTAPRDTGGAHDAKPRTAAWRAVWQRARCFNTKGHKELLGGMYRSTKTLIHGGVMRVGNALG